MVRWTAALAVTLLIVGCTPSVETKPTASGGQTTTIRDATGKQTTVTQDKDKAEFKDDKGNAMTIGGDKVPDLGVEIMPKLVLEKGSVIDAKTEDAKSSVAIFKTTESVDVVAKFYHDKLGSDVSESKASSSGSETATLTKQDGKKTISVVIVKGQADAETTVNISYNEKLK